MSQLVGKVLDSMPYEESYSLPYTLLISTLRKCETVFPNSDFRIDISSREFREILCNAWVLRSGRK
jgi:hypothetical protein